MVLVPEPDQATSTAHLSSEVSANTQHFSADWVEGKKTVNSQHASCWWAAVRLQASVTPAAAHRLQGIMGGGGREGGRRQAAGLSHRRTWCVRKLSVFQWLLIKKADYWLLTGFKLLETSHQTPPDKHSISTAHFIWIQTLDSCWSCFKNYSAINCLPTQTNLLKSNVFSVGFGLEWRSVFFVSYYNMFMFISAPWITCLMSWNIYTINMILEISHLSTGGGVSHQVTTPVWVWEDTWSVWAQKHYRIRLNSAGLLLW